MKYASQTQVGGRSAVTMMLALGLLAGCSEAQAPDDDALKAIEAPQVARIVPAAEALSGAQVATFDPATMQEAEIRKALESGRRCDFRYTAQGKPVLAFTLAPEGGASGGVIKLNGHLVLLKPGTATGAGAENGTFALADDPVRMSVIPNAREGGTERGTSRRQSADAIFEVGRELKVGYRGYLDCTA